jgi:hypothetical protein
LFPASKPPPAETCLTKIRMFAFLGAKQSKFGVQ